MGKQLHLLTVGLFLSGSLLGIASLEQGDGDWEDWIARQKSYSIQMMLKNISPTGGAPGSVVASPSKNHPDYFYHWIRDAALVMDSLMTLYETASDGVKNDYLKQLFDYVSFSRLNQLTPNRSGSLGEPKFYADGSAFNGDWGRPQNDGPALRALTLIRLARLFLKEGRKDYVQKILYDGRIPTQSVIKADLEFISHHWRETGFDLWEEVRGSHYYTRVLQRKALLEGADFSKTLGDGAAGNWYHEQAVLLEKAIRLHWDASKKAIVPTRDRTGGIDYKNSGLDSSVILALLHGGTKYSVHRLLDGEVLSTLKQLRDTFTRLYPVNRNGRTGIVIGRYPEDTYDGYRTGGTGNGWNFITSSFAEYYYTLREELSQAATLPITEDNLTFLRELLPSRSFRAGNKVTSGQPLFDEVLSQLRAEGDSFLKRIRIHVNPDGSLSEQINRDKGFQQGAPHLTWSYSSFLAAVKVL